MVACVYSRGDISSSMVALSETGEERGLYLFCLEAHPKVSLGKILKIVFASIILSGFFSFMSREPGGRGGSSRDPALISYSAFSTEAETTTTLQSY